MGEEINTTELRIKKFLGLNNKISDTAIDLREAAGLENVNIGDESLDQRLGSSKFIATAFTDKAGAVTKNITGAYETAFGGTTYQVAIGGDAFKKISAGAWSDITGAITITDDDDTHWSFATFIDNAVSDVIIAANGSDAPVKWTGTGNAAALASPPGNFNYPVVHYNKLWVAVNDIVYFSNFRNGEAWTTADDIIRFENKGENINGLYKYGNNIVVFQPTQISIISGSSTRDLFVETIVTGDGCQCHQSIQEVESRRYGNILVFLSTEGIIKGFNGSKNLIRIGDPAEPLFRSMGRGRFGQVVSANYKRRNQYWLGMSYGNNTENDQVVIYDYLNDIYTNESGKPLSSILYHTGNGIKSNAMAIFNQATTPILVTANYDGYLLQQDTGYLDDSTDGVRSSWMTGKIDFGTPSHVKLLSDFHLATTQSTDTNMSAVCTTDILSGIADMSIEAVGGLWGSLIWGTGLWTGTNTSYTRGVFTPSPSTNERPISGRYFQFQLNHTSVSEAMSIEDLVIGVSDLGMQPQFIE